MFRLELWRREGCWCELVGASLHGIHYSPWCSRALVSCPSVDVGSLLLPIGVDGGSASVGGVEVTHGVGRALELGVGVEEFGQRQANEDAVKLTLCQLAHHNSTAHR